MSPASSASLEFYAALREHDLRNANVHGALSFARIARDLLIRLAAAWAVQRGLETVPHEQVPTLHALFDLAILPDQPALIPSGGLRQLLLATAHWVRGGFDDADPFASSYQVWVGSQGDALFRLCGPGRPAPPPDGIVLDPAAGYDLAAELVQNSVTAIGHYDVHGLAMLALSLRSLRAAGVAEAVGVMGFEETGDIGKLWKRTIPRALKQGEDGAAVVLIDCPVHSRTPEHTLKALRSLDNLPAARLVLIDHHPDTIDMSPLLARDGVQLVLTDVLSCGLLGVDDDISRDLRILGALGDKVPEVAAAYAENAKSELHAANAAYQDTLLYFSPTPKPLRALNRLPSQELWEALARGTPVSPDLVQLTPREATEISPVGDLPGTARCGSVLFVTSRLTVLGRSWYALLEGLMENAGVSYAIALRVLDGNRANMLLLTHWKHTHMPPVRSFIPEAYLPRCLGHPAAVWVDLDKRAALDFLRAVAANANAFLGSAAEFEPVAALLQQNILDQAPSGHASSNDADEEPAL